MSNKNKHHHIASTWSTVLTFNVPKRTVIPFRVQPTGNATDGGISPGGLKDQIEILKRINGAKATIECYSTFVACALKEGFAFTPEDSSVITVTNTGKLTKAIDDHRSQVNGNPAYRENLEQLNASLQHLK